MAFNRIADRGIDALNPRTRMRALPAGLLQLRHANLFFYGSIAVFLLAAGMLNRLTLMLAPVALFVTLASAEIIEKIKTSAQTSSRISPPKMETHNPCQSHRLKRI